MSNTQTLSWSDDAANDVNLMTSAFSQQLRIASIQCALLRESNSVEPRDVAGALFEMLGYPAQLRKKILKSIRHKPMAKRLTEDEFDAIVLRALKNER